MNPSNKELESLKQLNLAFLQGTSHGIQLCSEAAEKLQEITGATAVSFQDLQIFFQKIKVLFRDTFCQRISLFNDQFFFFFI